MPEFKRVRIDASGAKVTVAHVSEGMTVLDEPALDRNLRPLGPVYPEQSGEPVQVPYLDWKKPDLEDEVARRNSEIPDEAAHIQVASPGNKPELAAALEAHDAATA